MERIAHNIIIKNEIKTGFLTNEFGQPTEEIYEYREFDIIDKEGFVLETAKYFTETTTVEEICNDSGIVFGVSTWIYESI
jgi:hypothetical protein